MAALYRKRMTLRKATRSRIVPRISMISNIWLSIASPARGISASRCRADCSASAHAAARSNSVRRDRPCARSGIGYENNSAARGRSGRRSGSLSLLSRSSRHRAVHTVERLIEPVHATIRVRRRIVPPPFLRFLLVGPYVPPRSLASIGTLPFSISTLDNSPTTQRFPA